MKKKKEFTKKSPLIVKRFILFFFHSAQKVFDVIWSNKLLNCIAIIAICIRLIGTNPGYPQVHPDEPSLQEATRVIIFERSFDPKNYYYGSLLPLIYAIGIVVFFIPLYFVIFSLMNTNIYFEQGPFAFWDFFWTKIERGGQYFDTVNNFLPYWTRYETAIVSGLTVVTAYLVGKKLFNKTVGIIAAFLIAVNFRHVFSSTFTLADGPVAFFALLSVYCSLLLIDKRKIRYYIIAGVAMGLALSVKYFVYILPIFFISHISSVWHQKKILSKKIKDSILSPQLFLACTIATLVFVAINPFLFINRTEVDRQFKLNATRYRLDSETVKGKLSPPFSDLVSEHASYPIYYLYTFGLGPILFISILIGFTYSIFRYPKQTILLSSAIGPFFLAMTIISGIAPVRNYAAIIPFLLFFPAVLIADINTALIKNKNTRGILTTSLTILIGSQTLWNSLQTTFYSSQPLNHAKFIAWAENALPVNSTIAHTSAVYIQKEHTGIMMDTYNNVNLSLSELVDKKAQWAMINSDHSTQTNANFWIGNTIIMRQLVMDENLLWNVIGNTYISLAMKELGYYRIGEFAKPSLWSIEPAVLVSKIPAFWSIKEDKMVKSFLLNDDRNDSWAATSPFIIKPIIFEAKTDENNQSTITIDHISCFVLMQVKSPRFKIQPNKWYSVTAYAKRTSTLVDTHNGFFRMNMYGQNRTVKTYISATLDGSIDNQKKALAGFSPRDATEADISFQIDSCNAGEKYQFSDIQIFESDAVKGSDFLQYSYFNQSLPTNFLWQQDL